MTHHVTIIGGGAIGLSLAWELAQRDLQVSLLERAQVGRATSWAGAGILPPANRQTATDPLDQLRGMSHELFPVWTDKLRSVTGIDCGFRRCGGWYLADSAGERAAMQGMTSYWDELEIRCEPVETRKLATLEPALHQWAERNLPLSAWWVPDEFQVCPRRYVMALERACRLEGIEIRDSSPVSDIRTTERYAEALVGERWHRSESIVICGGAWTGLIARSFNLDSSIVPIRGQMLVLKTAAPLLRSVVNVGHRYIVCRDDGTTLVGSCEEETGFQLGTTEPMLDSLREFAISIVPKLQSARRIDAWSGLRPMSFDGFPMIGSVPQAPNLYIAAGHFRSGIHLSPGTAVALADLLTHEPARLSLDAFRVGKQQSTLPVAKTQPIETPS